MLLILLAGCRSSEDVSGLRTQVFDKPSEYDLELVGNESFIRGTLQKAASEDLADFVQRDFPRASADDAAYSVESYYRARGFPFSRVRYELEREREPRPKLRLLIEEGARCTIAGITFEGARAFSQTELKKRVKGPTTSILGLGELYYVESQVSGARSAIEDLYFENGYLDCQVAAPTTTFSDDGTKAEITFSIQEGRQYHLGDVLIEGLEGAELDLARQQVASFKGRPYFPRLAYEVRSSVSDHYTRSGYPEAHADALESVDPDKATVQLTLQLHKGELVHISEVLLEGNLKTRDSFLFARIGLRAGDLYDRSAERAAFSELYSTGLFSSISIDLLGEGGARPLRVRVVEADTLSLTTEVGYGAFERARILVGITEENIAGTGRALRFEAKLAERAESLRLYLTDPWTFGKENILGVTTFWDLRKEAGFDSVDLGAGTNITRRVSRHFRNVYGYEYRFSDASNVSINLPPDQLPDDEGYFISELYLTNLYDSRDSVFLPTRGTWARLRTEVAPKELGSQLSFARVQARLASYVPLTEVALLAWTVHSGLIFPIETTSEIPLQERFFNGGQNSVRSFRENSLGPKDSNGTPVGGETYSVASLELRRTLAGNFTGALFFDAGNVSLTTSDYLQFADIRYALGPGLRWLLPIGPLRLDWGINPNPREDEPDWVLQFSVGVAF
jgi:outer membrane protein assembly complex protein YaeT